MSLHKSLRRKDSLTRRRNVLTRDERIQRLKETERWGEGSQSVFGLPKVAPLAAVALSGRKAAKEEKPAAGAEGKAPAASAAPASAPEKGAEKGKAKGKGKGKEKG